MAPFFISTPPALSDKGKPPFVTDSLFKEEEEGGGRQRAFCEATGSLGSPETGASFITRARVFSSVSQGRNCVELIKLSRCIVSHPVTQLFFLFSLQPLDSGALSSFSCCAYWKSLRKTRLPNGQNVIPTLSVV